MLSKIGVWKVYPRGYGKKDVLMARKLAAGALVQRAGRTMKSQDWWTEVDIR